LVAVGTLFTLQAEYADWLAALPDGLQGSATADALEAIVDLDLAPLADVEPPRGYGLNPQSTDRTDEKKSLTSTTPIREESVRHHGSVVLLGHNGY
jgi:hypothetical protein